ncbi:MAG: glycosyltransferase [Myxococcales bacterium]|nr:glycosyltransferase [Myxococcales bacterium]
MMAPRTAVGPGEVHVAAGYSRDPSTVANTQVPELHLLTGEYPPMPGGVSDYCAQLAAGLAAEGASVHVWAPATDGAAPSIDRVTVHRLEGGWCRRSLMAMTASLARFPRPRRLVVQYVPHAWGRRGLNLEFCRWLRDRSRHGDDISLMVHEPFYPWRLRDKPTRWLLALGQRWMIKQALDASERVYVAIPAWERYLRPYDRKRPMTWLPVPSNVPFVDAKGRVSELRARLAKNGELIVGTFSTYGPLIARLVREALPPLLQGHPDRVGLLLGRGAARMAAEIAAHHPSLGPRLVAPGGLDAESLSLHLQACTILVQPYPDGVTSRRGTIMAPLSHGAPIVTNTGFLSEGTWSETGCVALASGPEPREIAALAEGLLVDPDARAELGRGARRVYDARFSVKHTVRRLLES